MTAIILTCLISYFLAAIFKKYIYFFIAAFALIIFNVEVLSLFKGITGENILYLTFFETVFAFLLWVKKDKPLLKIPSFEEIKSALVKDKMLFVLSGALIFCILISFILALVSPVNEPDAQSYHALRALFWAKDGFISHFETADVRCHSMPVNSEIFYTWILSLTKKDLSFGLLQFFSYFLCIISAFKIMDNISVEKRIWAIIIFSSLPAIISQISSTQTDLTTGALLLASFYLVKEYKKENKNHLLYFSSLSMALACGVKSTGVIAAFPVILYYVFTLKKDFIKFFLQLIINFFIFSSYNYILNFINYGNFLGAKTALISHSFWGGIKAVFSNYIRYIFQFFDFSGFTIGFYINKYLLMLQDKVISFFKIPTELGVNVGLTFTNISMTEQVIGFGILGFLVFLPSTFAALFKQNVRIFAIIFFAQILVLSSTIAYMIFSIRFLVTFACFAIPVLSLSYFKKMNLYKFIITFFALFYLMYASLFLSQRPLFYLVREFIKNPSISEIQENMRDLNYKFYKSFNEALTMKNIVQPLCKNNNKIGIVVSNGYMLFSAKYLDMHNNCTIDTPNMLHINSINNYDYLITEKDLNQHIEAINISDNKNKNFADDKKICLFEGLDNSRNKRLLAPYELNLATNAICVLNKKYLIKEGFVHINDIYAEYPDFLKGRENETVVSFSVWGKQ